ncbi:MAG: hypothetical protein M3527_06265 [Actinomycetota bacterium]|nr:hypothetical protein [Acidimicrobiia bacterium]MDQ3294036.1 hypothetical protein [Actinomycetota bacterium]
MELKAGSRWRSAVCDTEVVVVKPPGGEVVLECGGEPMLPVGSERPDGATPAAGFDTGTPIGKRFAHEATGLELLATKGGAGTLAVDGVAVPLKDAKPLPASD